MYVITRLVLTLLASRNERNGGFRSQGGRNKHNIRYADDTVIIADSEAKFQRLVDRLDVECREIELKINVGKTEVMCVTKRNEQLKVNVSIGGQAVKQLRSFRHLGSLVNEDGRCKAEIKSRIAMWKANFGNMRGIVTYMS